MNGLPINFPLSANPMVGGAASRSWEGGREGERERWREGGRERRREGGREVDKE